ncbi:MAG: hypothetical protein WKG07_36120 [Hymenobacter sp.]
MHEVHRLSAGAVVVRGASIGRSRRDRRRGRPAGQRVGAELVAALFGAVRGSRATVRLGGVPLSTCARPAEARSRAGVGYVPGRAAEPHGLLPGHGRGRAQRDGAGSRRRRAGSDVRAAEPP